MPIEFPQIICNRSNNDHELTNNFLKLISNSSFLNFRIFELIFIIITYLNYNSICL